MSSVVHTITVDAADPYALSLFWAAVTGAPVNEDDSPGDPEAMVLVPTGTRILFVTVEDPKTTKNRIHLDLQPTDRTRDAEVERLLALGATKVGEQRNPNGSGWDVLADPEGNEFCVLRSAAEVAASRAAG